MMKGHAVVCVSAINPTLFEQVSDMKHVRLLRLQLVLANEFFKACPRCAKDKVLEKYLGYERKHLAESTELFSINDLRSAHKGVLAPFLVNAVDMVAKRITQDCAICRSSGHLCELCGSLEPMYPFNVLEVMQCSCCRGFFHQSCFSELLKNTGTCPRCKRISERRSSRGNAGRVYK